MIYSRMSQLFLSIKSVIELTSLLSGLPSKQKHHIPVRHALRVRSAVALSDYHALFRLYLKCPNLGSYLMDHFIERERVQALKIICKA
jgi:hypothetical protein